MTQKYFADAAGRFLGSFEGTEDGDYWDGTAWGAPPAGVAEVASAPSVAGQTWSGAAWVDTSASLAAKAAIAGNALIAAGMALVSTGTPSLNGTYAIDKGSTQNITAIYSGIKDGDGLPGGGSTFNYPDLAGTMHSFNTTTFPAFAKAARDYLYQISQGETPASPVTIA